MEEVITVLKVEPNKLPEVVTIRNDLDSLQKAVSIGADYQGLIELVGAERGVMFMLNEEGKLINLPANRICGNDVFCGVFYIVGDDGENICSLPECKIEKYKQIFNEDSFLEVLSC